MNTRSPSPLLIGMCSLLAVAGSVGPGAFRWVLLAIAGLIGLVLAIRASRPTRGNAPAELRHAAYPKEILSSLQRLSELNPPDATVAPPLHRLLWRLGISVPPGSRRLFDQLRSVLRRIRLGMGYLHDGDLCIQGRRGHERAHFARYNNQRIIRVCYGDVYLLP